MAATSRRRRARFRRILRRYPSSGVSRVLLAGGFLRLSDAAAICGSCCQDEPTIAYILHFVNDCGRLIPTSAFLVIYKEKFNSHHSLRYKDSLHFTFCQRLLTNTSERVTIRLVSLKKRCRTELTPKGIPSRHSPGNGVTLHNECCARP